MADQPTPAVPKAAPKPPEHKIEVPAGPADPAPPADVAEPAFLTAARAALGDALEQVSYWVGDWTLVVSTAKLAEACRTLRDLPEGRFDFCSDVTASDWPARDRRFDVVYCLYSTAHRHRVRVKVR